MAKITRGKHPGGRPTDYRPEYCKIAERLCRKGATLFDLGQILGVSDTTIDRWIALHPEFCASVKVGKDACDDRVERSLYERAKGFRFNSEKLFSYQGEVIRATTTEYVPPETNALRFWLMNRRPKQWRDVQRIEVGGPGEFSQMSDAELRAAIAQEERALALLPDLRPVDKAETED